MAFKSNKQQTQMEPIVQEAQTQEAQDPDANALLAAYYQQLAPFERRTCDIAREHLGSSFDLARSNGFLRWMAKTR